VRAAGGVVCSDGAGAGVGFCAGCVVFVVFAGVVCARLPVVALLFVFCAKAVAESATTSDVANKNFLIITETPFSQNLMMTL
jgi:hypothetical protein